LRSTPGSDQFSGGGTRSLSRAVRRRAVVRWPRCTSA
jgi:hypothetical protein